MKDLTTLLGKTIRNKDTDERREVTSVNEADRKLDTRSNDSEITTMAVASFERRWELVEPTELQNDPCVTEVVEADTSKAETQNATTEPMRMSEVVVKLENLFDLLNKAYFKNDLPRPVITVQSTPKAYGHCTTKQIWKAETDGMYEINIGAEFLNRPAENTAATMCHEMVHLYCLKNEIADTCQKGRYHNKTFKTEAEARDLEIGYDRTIGYSQTSPTEAFKKTLKDNGFELTVLFAREIPKGKAAADREKPRRYVCPVCGQEVKSTADLQLICGVCEVPMPCEI